MHQFIKRTLLFIAIACSILYALHKTAFFNLDLGDRITARIMYPFYAITGNITDRIDRWRNDRLAYDLLRDRYETLQKDYIAALDTVITLQTQRRANEQLKELATFTERYKLTHGTLARIIFKHIEDDSHYFLCNKGSRDGIKRDMVALYQNHLVGRITDVFDWYCTIMLITDQHSKIAGMTSQTHANGIVQGYNVATQCNFTYVSHLLTVQDHDLVISSGQGLVYPQGFCLGKIVLHNLGEKELYHHIDIQPVINLPGLTNVLLVDGAQVSNF